MYLNKNLFFIGIYIYLGLLFFKNGHTQPFLLNVKKEVSMGFNASNNGFSPFWIRSNQYGIIPIESNNLYLNAKLHKEFDSTFAINTRKLKPLGIGFGLDLVGNIGKNQQLILPEAYLKVRYKPFEFYIGRRKEIFGIVDSTLSSGSFAWSGNALPIPKVQLSIPNYLNILKNGLLAIKGGYAHGWFDNDRPFTKDVFLHQKWLYGRIGKPEWPVNLFGGFNHQAQWGGYSPFFSNNGKLPSGLKNYSSVVLGTRGAISDTGTAYFDENRVGNHLGSIDVSAKVKNNNLIFEIYRQSFYEDGSLFYLLNIQDGLTGISLTFSKKFYINKINFEILETRNQGGEFFIIDNPYLRGRDNYYFNAQFADGYTYTNRIIGTPFIQNNSLNWLNGKYEYNIFTDNNRVRLLHFGVSGNISSIMFQAKFSYSKNNGIYNDGFFDKNQFSTSLKLDSRINLLNISNFQNMTFALDHGDLFSKSYGFFLLLGKKF